MSNQEKPQQEEEKSTGPEINSIDELQAHLEKQICVINENYERFKNTISLIYSSQETDEDLSEEDQEVIAQAQGKMVAFANARYELSKKLELVLQVIIDSAKPFKKESKE